MKFPRANWLFVFVIVSVIGLAMIHARPAIAQAEKPLLFKSNLVYQGAFLLPSNSCKNGYECFAYISGGLAYDPARPGLYINSHVYAEKTAEVSIPEPVKSTNPRDLNRAKILQPFVDATAGRRNAVNPDDPNNHIIKGLLKYDGRLILSVFSYYDGSGSQTTSHFALPADLGKEGKIIGPVKVGSLYPGFVSGYMALIPKGWRAAFGGPALTGNCCLAIISNQSLGPAASVFDPNDIGKRNPVPATPVVGYPYHHALGTGYSTKSHLFNGTTQVHGVVFPVGTRSVLFIGRQGIGEYCYGPGTSNADKPGVHASGTHHICYDPADHSKGTHAYPYRYQVWAYDALDLLKVKRGEMKPYEVKPYTVWNFKLPFTATRGKHYLRGAAYDPASQTIYIGQRCRKNSYCHGAIHVFKVDLNVSADRQAGR